MSWEELKVYKPLTKDELKVAKKEICRIVSENLSPFGFTWKGSKLIRQSEDLFHIIHLDIRGSWMGASKDLTTEISITPIFDKDVFIKNFDFTCRRYIQQLIPNLKNYYQITKEYNLFADFISRKLIDSIIPYFDKYKNSAEVLKRTNDFGIDRLTEISEKNQNLILYCELVNHINNKALEILDFKINYHKNSMIENTSELEALKIHLLTSNWDEIDNLLEVQKQEVFKKLKIKK